MKSLMDFCSGTVVFVFVGYGLMMAITEDRASSESRSDASLSNGYCLPCDL